MTKTTKTYPRKTKVSKTRMACLDDKIKILRRIHDKHCSNVRKYESKKPYSCPFKSDVFCVLMDAMLSKYPDWRLDDPGDFTLSATSASSSKKFLTLTLQPLEILRQLRTNKAKCTKKSKKRIEYLKKILNKKQWECFENLKSVTDTKAARPRMNKSIMELIDVMKEEYRLKINGVRADIYEVKATILRNDLFPIK